MNCILQYGGRLDQMYCLAYRQTNQHTPFVTWGCDNQLKNFFWGHYFEKLTDALDDYHKRLGRRDPERTHPVYGISLNTIEALLNAQTAAKLSPKDLDNIAHQLLEILEQQGLYQELGNIVTNYIRKYTLKETAK